MDEIKGNDIKLLSKDITLFPNQPKYLCQIPQLLPKNYKQSKKKQSKNHKHNQQNKNTHNQPKKIHRKIVSHNINGYTNKFEKNSLYEHQINTINPDILLLQEIKSKDKNITEFPNYIFETTAALTRAYTKLPTEPGTSGGLLNGVHKRISDSCYVIRDDDCLYLCITIDENLSIAYLNAYCPPYDDRLKHEDSVLILRPIEYNTNVLLQCGFEILIAFDANGSLGNVMHDHDDKTNEFGIKYLLPFIDLNNLKIVNPRNKYTWFSHNGRSKATLDYVLIRSNSKYWTQNKIKCDISDIYTGSDHSIVITEIEFAATPGMKNKTDQTKIFQPTFSIKLTKIKQRFNTQSMNSINSTVRMSHAKFNYIYKINKKIIYKKATKYTTHLCIL